MDGRRYTGRLADLRLVAVASGENIRGEQPVEAGTRRYRDVMALMRHAASGRTLPRREAVRLSGEDTPVRITTEYSLEAAGPGDAAYEVRYEWDLVFETHKQAAEVHRERQPYPAGERLTYVQRSGGKTSGRRKALDTIGVACYRGILPRDLQMALGRRRVDVARIAALRLLAQRLGRSFLFFPEFHVYLRDTAWLRPTGLLVRALQQFWGTPR